MQIICQIDSQILLDPNLEGSKLMFEVWWEHNGEIYPEKGWVDFGYTILGWWVSNIIRISRGEEQGNFSFMDGPFSVNFQYQETNKILHLTSKDHLIDWNVPLREMIDALLFLSRTLQSNLIDANTLEAEQVLLQKYVAILSDLLGQLYS